MLTVSPFGPSFLPQPVVYSQPFDFVGPLFSYLFSYSYELFVVPKKVNSFAIKQIRTLCAKYRGWGGVRRLCALRACPAGRRVSVANPMFSAVCRLFVVSLRSFSHSLALFSRACSLFSQNTRVGGTCGFSRHSPLATRPPPLATFPRGYNAPPACRTLVLRPAHRIAGFTHRHG